MGLHNTAHYLKSKGRNDDTELVHMTKGEVQALKGLAAQHGGSLTTNPETGLPEAGFLSSVLPMVAGVAASAFLGPEMLPLVAGGIGLADYAATGSLTKGLLAGLSAYGGGELGGSLEALGSEGVQEAATTAGNEAIAGAGVETSLPANQVMDASRGMVEPQAINNISDAGKALQSGAISPEQYSNLAQQYSGAYATSANAASPMTAGLQAASAAPGKFLMNNATNIAMAGAPLLMDTLGSNRSTVPTATASGSTNPFGLKTLSPNFQGTFPNQPNPAYVAQYPNYKLQPYKPGVPNPTYPSTPGYMPTINAADGGLMQSGPAQVNFMGSDMYPQSQQQRSYYATPTQMPTSAQATASLYEPKTNPLTGEPTQNMREGGSVPSYNGDSPYGSVVGIEDATQELQGLFGHRPIMSTPTPSVGIVQDTDPNTRNLSPYEAALYRVKQKASAAGLGKNAVVLPAASTTYGKISPDSTPDTTDMASGGITGAPSLGSYAAGGNPRLLKGPGDGMSDSIPANIGGKQPARLADGEFVVPADVVSHLGNGSTDAGAKKLYAMMDNIRRARTGRKKQAPEVKADKYLPK